MKRAHIENNHSSHVGSGAFFKSPLLMTNLQGCSRLDEIMEKQIIRVGTTGDYKPFTYLNPTTKQFEGYDIDVAYHLAEQLGVEVEFIQTSWSTLMEDLNTDRFDIAMGGVSRNLERQKTAHLTQPYLRDHKAPLIRNEDKLRYCSVAGIDHPDVRIGMNPGGTNERFVRKQIRQAQIVVIDNNLSIPDMVAEGNVDVMITDYVEAVYYTKRDVRLYAAEGDGTFPKSEKVYMIPRGDLDYQNWIALWLEELQLQGVMDRLKAKWGLEEIHLAGSY